VTSKCFSTKTCPPRNRQGSVPPRLQGGGWKGGKRGKRSQEEDGEGGGGEDEGDDGAASKPDSIYLILKGGRQKSAEYRWVLEWRGGQEVGTGAGVHQGATLA